jgi:hypothetical protein
MIADKILATAQDCGAQAAESKPAQLRLLGRILSGLLMGSLTFALIGLTAVTGRIAALFLM